MGVLGLLDPAEAIGLREVETDFGATLVRWGVPEGAYLELPLLGPSTERVAGGAVVDFVLDPLYQLDGVPEPVTDLALPAQAAGAVIAQGEAGSTYDDVLDDSADSYAQARLIYLQNRRYEPGVAPAATDEDHDFNPYEDQP